MTVSSQTNKVIYIGNGVAKEFAIPFSFLEQEHIKVRQKKNDIQTERTDWTVKSGNLVFADAPESGAEIAIVREVPLTQETDYRDNEILHAETLERNFDKLTMQVQQLAEKSARAVTVDIFDDTAADSLIPSIRKAVSDCQTSAAASTAQAETAARQAAIASQKAAEAQTSAANTATALTTKANIASPAFTGTVKVPTPSSATAADKLAASTEWVKNQRQTGYGLGVPDWAHPTVLAWGTSYTAATAPQKNGWLIATGLDRGNTQARLVMGGIDFVVCINTDGGTDGNTIVVPYKAKTPFSTTGGVDSGNSIKFCPNL